MHLLLGVEAQAYNLGILKANENLKGDLVSGEQGFVVAHLPDIHMALGQTLAPLKTWVGLEREGLLVRNTACSERGPKLGSCWHLCWVASRHLHSASRDLRPVP